MTLTRASGTLTKPWSLAKSELDTVFETTTRNGDIRSWRLTSRIYTLKLTANRATGNVEITVSTPLPYTLLAVGALLLVLVTTATTTTHTALAALVLCLPITLIPLLPGIIHYQRIYQHLPDLLDIQQARITPSIAAPITGFLIGMWLIASSRLYQLLTLLLAAGLTGYLAYVVGSTPNSLRHQFPAFLLAFFSGFPLLLTTGNLVLLRIAADQVTTTNLVALIGLLSGVTISLLAIFAYLCNTLITQFQNVPNQPISSRPARVAWFTYFTTLNLLTLLLTAVLLTDYWWFEIIHTPTDLVRDALVTIEFPYPTATTTVILGILILPSLTVAFLWTINLYRELQQYRRIQAGTTASHLDGSRYPIRIIDSPHPVASVAPISLRQTGIVLSNTLCEELTRDELHAVIAHEEYHIHNRDPVWNYLSTLVGLLLGGRNILIAAYDYPRVEQEADQYAAEKYGTETLISALRTLEQLHTTSPQQSQPKFSTQTGLTSLKWLFTAPYHVLFGSLLLDHAHRSIEERVEALATSKI